MLGDPDSLKLFNGARASDAANFAKKVYPTIEAFEQQELTQRAIMEKLDTVGIKAANGGEWGLIKLQRMIARSAPLTA